MPFQVFNKAGYFTDRITCATSYEEKGESPIDEETQCNKCNDNYYECRQAFFTEKQAKILEQSVNNKTISTDNSPQAPQIQPTQPLNNCSNYQQIIKELQVENNLLAKKIDEAVSQKNTCELKTEQLFNYCLTSSQDCFIDAKTLFMQNFFSYNNLPLFIAVILILLLYFLRRKFKTTKNKKL